MYGYRKFFLTLAGVISFTLIGMKNAQADFMSLGIGLGFLLAPIAAANAAKYKYQSVNGNKQ